jgi:hypothetical protein
MSENPKEFLKHLLPVLEKIERSSGTSSEALRLQRKGAESVSILARSLARVSLKYFARSL